MNQITIRKYQKEDISDFYTAIIESKAQISKWLPWCHEAYSIEDTKQWINQIVPEIWESKRGCEFVIVEAGSNKVLGGCCLEQINWIKKEANIGYWVRTSETKKGIATYACHFLLHFGFSTLNLEIIKVIPSAENEASKKVAEKLPYEAMEVVKNGFKIRDNISDAVVYSITRKSFIKKT